MAPDSGTSAPRLARFGGFQVDLRAGELQKRGSRVRLQQRLWPSETWDDFDHGLNKAVNKLRETLGDSAESPRFIETLPKRGYRFLAPLEVVGGSTEKPALETKPEAP